jgi:hypothetical protein
MSVCRIACLPPLALLFCGCGTMANLGGKADSILGPVHDPEYKVYGGIQNDFESVRDFFNAESPKKQPETFLWPLGLIINELEGFFLVTGPAVVDFPFSLVGDTLTLPITIQKTLEKQRKQTSGDATASPDGKEVNPGPSQSTITTKER